MSDQYSVVLQEVPAAHSAAIQAALGRLFGIKEATCANVVGSAPIVIVGGLARAQAAALVLALRGLEVAGARVVFRADAADELPHINWPKLPQILKAEIDRLVDEYGLALPTGGRLIDQLTSALDERTGTATAPAAAPAPAASPEPASAPSEPDRQVFEEADLGEITPFSNRPLPSTPPRGSTIKSGDQSGSSPDVGARMDEMFPDDEDGLIPNTQDITSILDRLLPDEERSGGSGPQAAANGSGNHQFSVFLARIADDNRRKKAIPLLSEMTGISEAEAEKLSRKVIIPVLKNVSKEDAETAKHRFAEIGVLARIKGG